MKRRELFKFLAAAPAAVAVGLTADEPKKPKKPEETTVRLPVMKPGESVTIIAYGPNQWVML